MHDPVQDGVCHGRIGESRMPVVERELARADGGPPLGAVIEHLHEVTAVDVRERGKTLDLPRLWRP